MKYSLVIKIERLPKIFELIKQISKRGTVVMIIIKIYQIYEKIEEWAISTFLLMPQQSATLCNTTLKTIHLHYIIGRVALQTDKFREVS